MNAERRPSAGAAHEKSADGHDTTSVPTASDRTRQDRLYLELRAAVRRGDPQAVRLMRERLTRGDVVALRRPPPDPTDEADEPGVSARRGRRRHRNRSRAGR